MWLLRKWGRILNCSEIFILDSSLATMSKQASTCEADKPLAATKQQMHSKIPGTVQQSIERFEFAAHTHDFSLVAAFAPHLGKPMHMGHERQVYVSLEFLNKLTHSFNSNEIIVLRLMEKLLHHLESWNNYIGTIVKYQMNKHFEHPNSCRIFSLNRISKILQETWLSASSNVSPRGCTYTE